MLEGKLKAETDAPEGSTRIGLSPGCTDGPTEQASQDFQDRPFFNFACFLTSPWRTEKTISCGSEPSESVSSTSMMMLSRTSHECSPPDVGGKVGCGLSGLR